MQLTTGSVNRPRWTYSVFRGKAVFSPVVSGTGGTMSAAPVHLRLLGLFLAIGSHDVSACSQSTAPALVETASQPCAIFHPRIATHSVWRAPALMGWLATPMTTPCD